MRATLKTLFLFAVLTMCVAAYADITVGNYDSGNCYPFMCNDSGSNVGMSIDFMQVYNSAKFPGAQIISSMTWYYDAVNGGNETLLGGNYSFYWGYSAVGMNITGNLPGNYNGGANFLGTLSIPAGGFNYNGSFTVFGWTPFTYNPAMGDLILEIVVNNQDNVPNFSGNGYNQADYTGIDTVRAYCIGAGCGGPVTGALVTTFGSTSATPEPGTLIMLGTGVLGLAGTTRRKLF